MRLYALASNVLITAVLEPCQEFPGDERKSYFQEQENFKNVKGSGLVFHAKYVLLRRKWNLPMINYDGNLDPN